MVSLLLSLVSCGFTIYLVLKVRPFKSDFGDYERRLSHVELSIVRSVMEDNPTMVEGVLKTQAKLYGSMSGKEALREARRLHGLEA